jgi:hypothetical protein
MPSTRANVAQRLSDSPMIAQIAKAMAERDAEFGMGSSSARTSRTCAR